MRIAAFYFVSTFLAAGAANGAQMTTQMEPVAACMARAANELHFNGIVYARHGDGVAERVFGKADAAGKEPISTRTTFSIASASKMFTAVAIGRLVDRGAVAFDAPISRYLPGLKAEFANITVAQLLNHTSGLGDYFNPSNKSAIDAATTATDLLPLALASAPAFAPGSRRAYSNSGFVVLGAIIEKVSGLTYAQFAQKEILDPLAMADTHLDAQGSAEPMTRMSPGGMLEQPMLSPLRQIRASPAGGAVTTAADISLFLGALSKGSLLSSATTKELLVARPDPSGQPGIYGYGFNVGLTSPLRVGHGGGAPGVNAEIALYPESGWQLIALSNNDPPVATRMVTVLEKAVFSRDTEAACDSALADPALRAPMPGVRLR